MRGYGWRDVRLRNGSAAMTSLLHIEPERIKMKLHEAIKGMEVKSWERRENSNGKCTVYVRFVPKSSAPTVSVKEVS